MSRENFLMLLQQLITMAEPDNEESINNAITALKAVYELAVQSQKSDPETIRMIRASIGVFSYLLNNKDAFAGKKGSYRQNKIKRERLGMVLMPSC